MERVAVVGTTGLLGVRLVEYLRTRAFWVRAVDLRGHDGHPLANERITVDPADPADAARAVSGVGHVYILDLVLPRDRPVRVPAGILETEVAMARCLLDAAVPARVNRVLYALSSHNQPPWCDAVDLLAPLLANTATRGVETRIALLPNVYGPGPARSVIADLAAVAAGRPTAGNPVIEAGQDADTNAAAPLEYVVDVVVGLYLLMRSNHREPLLIAGPARYPLSAVASELSRLVLRPLVTAPGGKPPFFLPPLTMTDDTRAALNWTPPTTLHAGLIEVLRSMSVPVEGNTP